jgi:hypothetical protein
MALPIRSVQNYLFPKLQMVQLDGDSVGIDLEMTWQQRHKKQAVEMVD